VHRDAVPILRVSAALLVVLAGGAFGDEPAATPTPSPTPVAGERSLSDVAGSITLDRGATGEGAGGGIVISNENLPELAGKGAITEVTRQGSSTGQRQLANVIGTGPEVEGEGPGFVEDQEKKAYWQAIYQQQVDLATSIRQQVDTLDSEIPGLWRDFYAWDDPAYRDGVIKPRIDEAMARRQKLEADLQETEASLAKIKEDARRDGAQPGWWRGFEAPPTPVPTRGVMPP
jgi:hypothetical protein